MLSYKQINRTCIQTISTKNKNINKSCSRKTVLTTNNTKKCDVLIVGSGPAGATFASMIVKQCNCKVIMVDVGRQTSKTPGEHLKNAYIYQRNVNPFVDIVKGNLLNISVPTSSSPITLDPISARVPIQQQMALKFVRDGINPNQDQYYNLGACAATYCVGGMGTHWTCSTPRLRDIEKSSVPHLLFEESELNTLYERAEKMLKTNNSTFVMSVRRKVLLDCLKDEYKELRGADAVQDLPLAVERINSRYVKWTAPSTILEDILTKEDLRTKWELMEEHMCEQLITGDGCIMAARIKNLIANEHFNIEAKYYVICSGAINTPQLLWKSNIRPYALGRYLTEQPLAFCQVVLKEDIINRIRCGLNDDKLDNLVNLQRQMYPNDPVIIPVHDMDPNIWIPASEYRPWHCQIHKDAFSYGGTPLNIDTRLIVDLRWFGTCVPNKTNCVTFDDTICDVKGMPQATFHYELTEKEAFQQHLMMKDMLRAASALGGFLPGSEPQFMEPGKSLHVEGTTRIGNKNDDSSVVDVNSKVWNYSNLFIGGNSVIPYGNACNPTLTNVALALKSSDHIIKLLKSN